MRGCFGGCTFCSITAHQGRIIQSRSPESVLGELRRMGQDPSFSGVVSDIGGPTANMYQMNCTRPEVEAKCKRLSCVHPKICKLLGTDHGRLVDLMKQSREVPGIDKVYVASGIRMDLAQQSPEYMAELVKHHVGGHLKVAPEHTDSNVLRLMKKPDSNDFEGFAQAFQKASNAAGKEAICRAVLHRLASRQRLERHDRPGRVSSSATATSPTRCRTSFRRRLTSPRACTTPGLDPFTGEEVFVARHLRDRKLQRALLQFFKPENYFEVRQALSAAGRSDLIGSGCDCLIPAQPPRAAIEARRRRANEATSGDHYHSIANPEKREPVAGEVLPKEGYRPGRKTARRQDKKRSRRVGGR